eukprot:comp22422_c0_seq6/m.54842 comp22422_c0_seq6/g.54842  ORF comp22422_c0_seq6/g.54842 comp22422_c0_seq6/m.54842 type:complete len:311 (+) comp22422_c0_seq6:532-1464(+)
MFAAPLPCASAAWVLSESLFLFAIAALFSSTPTFSLSIETWASALFLVLSASLARTSSLPASFSSLRLRSFAFSSRRPSSLALVLSSMASRLAASARAAVAASFLARSLSSLRSAFSLALFWSILLFRSSTLSLSLFSAFCFSVSRACSAAWFSLAALRSRSSRRSLSLAACSFFVSFSISLRSRASLSLALCSSFLSLSYCFWSCSSESLSVLTSSFFSRSLSLSSLACVLSFSALALSLASSRSSFFTSPFFSRSAPFWSLMSPSSLDFWPSRSIILALSIILSFLASSMPVSAARSLRSSLRSFSLS